jgi:ABC-2 type transport system ATP-binding protein
MRQRLGLAAALLRSPRLLLLDEPTSGLDPAGTKAVAELVRELAGEGVAVLLSSHQIGELEKVCDAYTVLRQGRVVWDGSSEELVSQAPASAYALVTSDDAAALRIAADHLGVRAGRSRRGGLALAIDAGSLDDFVLALGAAGVAIRRLEQVASPLETMFFSLVSEDGAPVAELGPEALAETVVAGR